MLHVIWIECVFNFPKFNQQRLVKMQVSFLLLKKKLIDFIGNVWKHWKSRKILKIELSPGRTDLWRTMLSEQEIHKRLSYSTLPTSLQ